MVEEFYVPLDFVWSISRLSDLQQSAAYPSSKIIATSPTPSYNLPTATLQRPRTTLRAHPLASHHRRSYLMDYYYVSPTGSAYDLRWIFAVLMSIVLGVVAIYILLRGLLFCDRAGKLRDLDIVLNETERLLQGAVATNLLTKIEFAVFRDRLDKYVQSCMCATYALLTHFFRYQDYAETCRLTVYFATGTVLSRFKQYVAMKVTIVDVLNLRYNIAVSSLKARSESAELTSINPQKKVHSPTDQSPTSIDIQHAEFIAEMEAIMSKSAQADAEAIKV